MADQNITDGVVSFEDGVKANEEYAPAKKVRVELTFAVAEGEDGEAVVVRVGDIARAQVARLLGKTVPEARGSTAEYAAADETEKAKRTRRTKAQIAADEAAAAVGDPAAISADDAASVGEPDGPTSSGSTGDAQTSDDAADIGDEWDLPADEPAEVITDADLNSHVQKKNGELKNPTIIRELIGSYNPDKTKPFQLRQIPAGDRREFLNKLAALKAA